MFFPEFILQKNTHVSLGVLKAGGLSCPSLACWQLRGLRDRCHLNWGTGGREAGKT